VKMWLEMSRDEAHGGPGWAFTECLWSPSHKRGHRGKWAFWDLLLKIQEGDIVFHLQGGTHRQHFVGYSTADSDGYKTIEKPPQAGKWEYASSYYRVPLKDFTAFVDTIPLDTLFSAHNKQLREYFQINHVLNSSKKELLFYVIQSNRLRCQNGAYCSEISNRLADILFGFDRLASYEKEIRVLNFSVRTGMQLRQVATRLGQDEFSIRVKANYDWRCCFPGCQINERRFLVGAHIARWSDAPELRGKISNGLCLCLMHDKAFEIGLFTLNKNYEIVLNPNKAAGNKWAETHIRPYVGKRIILGSELPAINSITRHWKRVEYQI
jgi:putative restriction endonuclease